MSDVVWVNGTLRGAEDHAISPLDHGFTVGDGVFETMEAVDGVAFALTRHLLRLEYSASRMGLTGLDTAHVRKGVLAVLAEGGEAMTRVRVTVSSGSGPHSSIRGNAAPTVVVVAADSPPIKECRAVRAPWKRNERSPIAGVKSTSYGENVVMVQFARAKGADEALIANTHGHLCEGTGSNVFIERGGELLTPPLASGCLPGITRGLALEWGAHAGLPVRVAAPGELEMAVLDEVAAGDAFAAVTSSTRHVQPLAALDGKDLKAGPLLSRLAEEFDRRASNDPDPAPPRDL
ncbi:aminotransferase class IV [Demequina sp.]|uniref:aminotransferase class IV n=1 Tax=Demequina sp. TaxID=2050685 RepID=UPI003D14D458